jgi:hypothetical protein
VGIAFADREVFAVHSLYNRDTIVILLLWYVKGDRMKIYLAFCQEIALFINIYLLIQASGKPDYLNPLSISI